MSDRVYLVPLWLRGWHWTNAALFLVLITTGVSLHFGSPAAPLVPFATARLIHNTAGILLAINYLYFLIGNARSGNWRQYVPEPQGFIQRALRQQRYYASGIFKGEPLPFPVTPAHKFNPLQQITYLAVAYGALPLLIVTGLLYLFPEYAPVRILGFGGIWPLALLHYLIGLLLVLFMVGHLYLATAGTTPTADFRTMISGWHEGQGERP